MKRSDNSLRIIAGTWRSRLLKFPDAPGLRPTADRVRETLFNWLQSALPGERCLDLFAGSGACGMEALSRGAAQVTFIDASAQAAGAIRSNLNLLAAEQDRYQVLQQDALAWLGHASLKPEQQFGIVFMDPPFADRLHAQACIQLEASGVLKPDAQIYLENDTPLASLTLPANWQMLKSKRAGSVHFALYQRVEQE